ncbi:uncharacterized protein METZ01_LOCUS505404, partial [marine metagenome]
VALPLPALPLPDLPLPDLPLLALPLPDLQSQVRGRRRWVPRRTGGR